MAIVKYLHNILYFIIIFYIFKKNQFSRNVKIYMIITIATMRNIERIEINQFWNWIGKLEDP